MSGQHDFHGQRWIYEQGNNRITLENAWTMGGACQERVTVNDEIVHHSPNAMYFSLGWKPLHVDEWLSPDGAQTISLEVRSGLSRVHARVRIDGEVRPWSDYFNGRWTGALGHWPE